MLIVRKKSGREIIACRLGDNSSMEQKLLADEKIRRTAEDRYEVFSREAAGGEGELARKGDYVKLDSDGFPYPNEKEWFEQRNCSLGQGRYLQMPERLKAWDWNEPPCKEIEYLIKNHKLIINEEFQSRYYKAFLWGTWLYAAKDAVIVFYQTSYDASGEIMDIDFSFVARTEFERIYDIL